jgi:predicted small lipoprotein YifL
MSRTQAGVILLIALLQIASCQGPEHYPPPAAGPGTDQGWDAETTQRWQHVDQGTAFFPYEWFVALEQANGLAGCGNSGQGWCLW